MIFILDRFTHSAFGLSTAVKEFATVTEAPRVSARLIDPDLLERSSLRPIGFWATLLSRSRSWHVDDMFAPYCLGMSALGLLSGRQVVLCPHGMLDGWALNNGRKRSKRLALSGLDLLARVGRLHVHALNQEEARLAVQFLPHACCVEVVPNGVPSDILDARQKVVEHRPQRGPLVIGCMSRISPKKNQMAIVDLAILMRQTRPDLFDGLIFRIDGQVEDAAYAQELVQRIAIEGLAQKVTLGGTVPFERRATCLAGYDIFFFPSKSEGMPYVVLEAMALGVLPLVSKQAQCDFVTPYGGRLFHDMNEAIWSVPASRAEIQAAGVDVDSFLAAFDKEKLRAFMAELSR